MRNSKATGSGRVSNVSTARTSRLAAAAAVALTGAVAQANTVTSQWNGTANTTWSNAGNWGTAAGVPSTTVGALFDSTYTNQPNLTANATTDGLWVATGVGQNVTINASSANTTLTLGGTTFSTLGTSSVTSVLMMDDTAGHNLTFGANLNLTIPQTDVPNASIGSTAIDINDHDSLTIAGSLASSNGAGWGMSGDGTGTVDVTGTLGGGGGGPDAISNITLILEQNNPTLSPAITMNAGSVLRLDAAGAIPTGKPVNLLSTGTTLQMRTDTSTTFTGNYSFGGGTNTLDLGPLNSASNNTVTLNGSLTVDDVSTLNLTSSNGYSLITTGTISTGHGFSGTATLSPNGTTMTIQGNVIPATAGGTGISQIVNLAGNTAGNSISGNLGDNLGGTKGTSSLSVQKTSTSTWLLSGTNTYSGTTAVSGGTLIVNGNDTAATGIVTVSGTGTLGGTGIIGGNTTITTGTLSPGDAPGTLTFVQNLTMNSNSTYSFSGGDLTAVDVALTLNKGWILNLGTGLQADPTGSVVLFTYGTDGGVYVTPTILNNTYGSLTVTDNGTGDVFLNGVSAAVPEPTTFSLLAVTGLFALRRKRRRA